MSPRRTVGPRATVQAALLVTAGATLAGCLAPDSRPPPEPVSEAPGQSAPWSRAVADRLATAEYGPRFQPAPEAANRAQNLRIRWRSDGAAVVTPRTGDDRWRLALGPASWGRGETLRDASSAPGPGACTDVLAADGSCVRQVVASADGLRSWFENTPRGLEQGWTVDAAPPGSGPLVVRLRLDGAIAQVDADGRGATFVTPDRALRYAHLAAFDADGAPLAAELADAPGGLAIAVDDRGARYPVTIDPVLSNPSWSVEGDQLGAMLGNYVAGAGDVDGDGYGDVLVASALYDSGQTDEGAVWLYPGGPAGLAVNSSWMGEGNQQFGWFGTSAAGAGDVDGDGFADVLIGAQQQSNGQTEEGRAHLYLGGPTGLAATPAWSGESNQPGAFYGKDVAGAGDVNGDGYSDILVGCIRWHGGLFNEGAAFLHLGGPTGPGATAAWSVEGNQLRAEMGWSVAGAGDVNGDGYADIVVSAYLWDGGETDEGAAFLFFGGPGGPSTTADWTIEEDLALATVSAVGGAGDVNGDGYADVIVGSAEWSGPEVAEGRARVFHGSPTGPSTVADWQGEADQADAFFGWAVSPAGDVDGDGYADVVVGVSAWDDPTFNEGKAVVHLGSPTGLAAAATWTYEVDQSAAFGWSVASAGDVDGDGRAEVLVGSNFYDGDLVDEGGAFLFEGVPAGPGPEQWSAAGAQAGAELGSAAAGAGDVNGDGRADLVVGAALFDAAAGADAGRAAVYLGAAGGPAVAAAWTDPGVQGGEGRGGSVAGLGDVDGDGLGDLAVAARDWDGAAGADAGVVRVHAGTASGVASTASFVVEGAAAGDGFGIVAGAGDVNGDGFADLLVGAPSAEGQAGSTAEADEGAAFLYLGSASGVSGPPAWSFEADQAGAGAGAAVAGVGDVDGDGYDDIAVGAPGFAGDAGRVWVFLGGPAGPGAAAVRTYTGTGAAELGASLGRAGDVNGDGFSDLVVGAPHDGAASEGAAYVYLGSAAGPAGTASWSALGGRAGARLGESAVGAGDVDGDGFADLLLGAPGWDDLGTDQGRALLYPGSATGPAATPSWTLDGGAAGDRLGEVVAGPGDLDGDGFADLLVCAPGSGDAAAPPVDEGECAVHLGNGGGALGSSPLPPTARAVQPSSSTPLAPGGRSTSTTSFDVVVDARSPFGRGRVKVQVEVEPQGSAFDGLGLQTSPTWTDSGVAGVALQETVTGLTPETAHHWRARLLYDPVDAVPQASSGWVHGGRPGDTEGAHLRAGCLVDTDADGQCDSFDLDDDDDDDPDVTDCDDTDPSVFTGAPEVCNAVDDDCDGAVDDGFDTDGDGVTTCGPDGTPGTTDDDCDDAVATTFPAAPEACNAVDDDCDSVVDDGFDTDGDGVTTCGPDGAPGTTDDDCDDAVATTYPAAPELCNAVDDDCDGVADDGLDTDGDGFTPCGADGNGATAADNDCDDTNVAVFPGAVEVCNAVDDDCDALVDDGFDGDVDGWTVCGPDGVFATADDDCDDALSNVHPGAAEACDGWDTDCSGARGTGAGEPDELDVDGDTWFVCVYVLAGANPAFGGGDCDDIEATVFPGAPEVEDDGVDQDCNGADTATCWLDADEDGFGVPTAVLDGDGDCTDDPGQSAVSTDCDDTDASVFPGAVEACDDVDSDCDVPPDLVDDFDDTDGDGEPDCIDEDDDDDGFDDDEDCGPIDPDVYPGAVEVCDDVDSDCDEDLVDESVDTDGDGIPDCLETDADDDGDPAATDCDDTDATVFTGAEEIPEDGIDQDCDGVDAAWCFRDADRDGFGAGEPYAELSGVCSIDTRSSTLGTDCDDLERTVYPGAEELCDGIDTDCDPLTTAEPGEEDIDLDGWWGCEGDCDDLSADASPEVFEEDCDVPGDQDCDGLSDADECRGRVRFDGNEEGCAGCGATVAPGASWLALALLGARRRRRGRRPA